MVHDAMIYYVSCDAMSCDAMSCGSMSCDVRCNAMSYDLTFVLILMCINLTIDQTAQVNVNEYDICRRTVQVKVNEYDIYRRTVQVKVNEYDIYRRTAQVKVNEYDIYRRMALKAKLTDEEADKYA